MNGWECGPEGSVLVGGRIRGGDISKENLKGTVF